MRWLTLISWNIFRQVFLLLSTETTLPDALINAEILNITLITLKILHCQRYKFVKCQSIKLLQGLPSLLTLLYTPNFCVYRLRRASKRCGNHVVCPKISLHAIYWFGRIVLKSEFCVHTNPILIFPLYSLVRKYF